MDTKNTNYDSDNSSTDSYDKLVREYNIQNNILSFIKEILTTIDYTLVIQKIKNTEGKTENSYTIKMNSV